jgi:Tol biopolymer transport system component
MNHSLKRITGCLVTICIFQLVIVNTVFAQAFGRNKVQYQTFEFKQLKTSHYTIYFYSGESTAVHISACMLEKWYSRYSKMFELELPKSQPVIFYANQADFQQTNAIPGLISQATGGVTEGTMNRMVIPLTGIFSENDHVIGHELVHAFQFAEIQKFSDYFYNFRIPLWFVEGLAEYLSLGSHSTLTSMWMRDAVFRKDVPTFSTIERDPSYFPYRFGHAICAYIAGRWSDKTLGSLFSSVVKMGWESGFVNTLGMSADSVSKLWRKETIATYSNESENRTRAAQAGKTLQSSKNINLSPSISPDGKYISFLSARDLFSIDMYIADASSGKTIKKLVSSESGERYETLRFINFSGAWSPDSKHFAFVVFSHGDNAIVIENVKTNVEKRMFHLSGAEEINHIAWSPDGRTLAVSATDGAVSNLYIYDLLDKRTKKITDDLYAEIQPGWSPNGKTIAFVTDRQSSENIDTIPSGTMRIGLMNTESDSVTYLSIAQWANHINPQFSPDGNDLYFIADPDGISNIYRYSFVDSTYYKVTNVSTGVSGLTELSPAMSVSSKSGKIVFNIFDKKNYLIQMLDSSKTKGDTFYCDYSLYLANTALPPKGKSGGFVDSYLLSPDTGNCSKNYLGIKLYQPKLRLWYIGQIFGGLTAGPFGVSAGGQVSLLFSDLLGNHILGVGLQSTGGWQNLGGSLAYLNQKSRLNWGYIFSHFPYVTSRVLNESDSIDINSVIVPVRNTTIIGERVYEDLINAYASYPLSIHRRFELRGGYLRIGYSSDAFIVKSTNDTLDNFDQININPPSALNQMQFNGAFVGDFSYTGFTGPIMGRRYRFEIQPSVGSIFFTDITGDMRFYKFFKPVTLGFRIFSWGRFFGQSQKNVLPQAYLGYEDWVRGYSMGSFELSSCTSEDGSCPEFERLLGTRVAVANAEVRLPLLGNDQLGLINFPYIPLDIVGFFDAGVAWTASSPIVWRIQRRSDQRIPVFSTGVAIRFNLLGALVFQFFSAYPFQRPGEGFKWGFFIAPGW